MIRRMGEFEVIQRTKDGCFSATHLLKQWNDLFGENRQLVNFWNTERLPEVMYEIALGEGLTNKEFKSLDFNELKNMLSNTTRGKYGGTWMHPYLFMKLAMYINAKFEYQVMKFE